MDQPCRHRHSDHLAGGGVLNGLQDNQFRYPGNHPRSHRRRTAGRRRPPSYRLVPGSLRAAHPAALLRRDQTPGQGSPGGQLLADLLRAHLPDLRRAVCGPLCHAGRPAHDLLRHDHRRGVHGRGRHGRAFALLATGCPARADSDADLRAASDHRLCRHLHGHRQLQDRRHPHV